MRIDTPVNQQRHTNIAVVRSKTKPRFELACYKNKVIDYRNGIEKDLSKVLQTDEIFTKVSDGTVAKSKDLQTAFGTTDKTKIAIEILQHGELQISEKERKLMYETMFRDILNFVVNQCLNPDTKRPYTAGLIEREMKNIHFAVKPNKSTKVQALKLIKKLEKKIPIVRARMRLKIIIDSKLGTKLKKWFQSFDEDEYLVEKETFIPDDKTILFHVLIDPGLFRQVDEWVVNSASGITEVIDPCVQELGDKSIEEYDASIAQKKEITKGPKSDADEDAEDENSEEAQDEKDNDEERKPSKTATKQKKAKKNKDDDSDTEDQPPMDSAQAKRLAKRAARKAKKNAKTQHYRDEDSDDEDSHQGGAHSGSDDEELETTTMKPKKSKSKQTSNEGKRASKKDKRRAAVEPEKKSEKKVNEEGGSKKKGSKKKAQATVDDLF